MPKMGRSNVVFGSERERTAQAREFRSQGQSSSDCGCVFFTQQPPNRTTCLSNMFGAPVRRESKEGLGVFALLRDEDVGRLDVATEGEREAPWKRERGPREGEIERERESQYERERRRSWGSRRASPR